MDFPLRDLNETEKQVVNNAPIIVGILIGCADGEMSQDEMDRIEEVIKTKTFSEKNDVHYLYDDIASNDLTGTIANIFDGLGNSAQDKATSAIAQLTELNSILPKLNPTYAIQYRDSLLDLAVAVAKASGGVFGIGTISEEEKDLIDLPMINEI